MGTELRSSGGILPHNALRECAPFSSIAIEAQRRSIPRIKGKAPGRALTQRPVEARACAKPGAVHPICATDEGAPGDRIPKMFYGAYVRDLEGNKLCFMAMSLG